IEAALLDGRIDLAVHSFKDLPSSSPDALTIAAFLPREDPRDALVSRSASLASLPDGATVGTGSARRQALIRDVRPRLDLRPIRGNVDTRLGRVARGDLDAVVVAAAGLARLERSDAATEILDPATFIPSPGQGILAVQARRDDPSVYELAHALDDPETRVCAQAERSVAVAVDAGCQTPFGAYAKIQDGEISVSAFLAPDGVGGIVRRAITGSREDALEIGGAVGVALATAAARAS